MEREITLEKISLEEKLALLQHVRLLFAKTSFIKAMKDLDEQIRELKKAIEELE